MFSRNKFYLIVVASIVLVLGVLTTWMIVSSYPVYANSHHHSSSRDHDHLHTHSEELTHGHHHVGLIGTTTHAHPHQHGHHHQHQLNWNNSELDGLTEIGHRHDANATVHFWAKAEAVGDTVQVICWTHRADNLINISAADCGAKIYSGSQLVCAINLQTTTDGCQGRLPDDYSYLSTQVIKISSLIVEGSEFDAVLPLEARTAISPGDGQ